MSWKFWRPNADISATEDAPRPASPVDPRDVVDTDLGIAHRDTDYGRAYAYRNGSGKWWIACDQHQASPRHWPADWQSDAMTALNDAEEILRRAHVKNERAAKMAAWAKEAEEKYDV